jgi:hypothetical protein
LSIKERVAGCEKVNESRPVDKGNDGYDAASGSRAEKPHFDPIEKVRESIFKGF